jgi:Restriction endonuclease fold toxin 3
LLTCQPAPSKTKGESEFAGYFAPAGVNGSDGGGENGFLGYLAPSQGDGSDVELGSDRFDFGDGTSIGIDSSGFEIAFGDSEFAPWDIFGDPLFGIGLTLEAIEAIVELFDEVNSNGDNLSVSDPTSLFDESITFNNDSYSTSLFDDRLNAPDATISISETFNDPDSFEVVDPNVFDPNNLNENKDFFDIYDGELPGTQFIPPLTDSNQPSIFPSPDIIFEKNPNVEVFPIGDDLFTPYLEIGTYDESQGLSPVNKPDAAADALAQKLGGQSRVKFNSDPNEREFDTISDRYVAQTKPGLQNFAKKDRNQAKETFEAASQTGKEVYYEFEGQPAQKIIDKLREYEQRYQIKLTIDILNK